jgi:hypothetical protein
MQQWSAMCRWRLVDGEETKQPGRRNKTAGNYCRLSGDADGGFPKAAGHLLLGVTIYPFETEKRVALPGWRGWVLPFGPNQIGRPEGHLSHSLK